MNEIAHLLRDKRVQWVTVCGEPAANVADWDEPHRWTNDPHNVTCLKCREILLAEMHESWKYKDEHPVEVK